MWGESQLSIMNNTESIDSLLLTTAESFCPSCCGELQPSRIIWLERWPHYPCHNLTFFLTTNIFWTRKERKLNFCCLTLLFWQNIIYLSDMRSILILFQSKRFNWNCYNWVTGVDIIIASSLKVAAPGDVFIVSVFVSRHIQLPRTWAFCLPGFMRYSIKLANS